jgi:hypothetical protein
MRVIDTIAHPHFKITVFGTDLYFYVEIEAGPMKQCYKFSKDKVGTLKALRAAFDAEYLEKIHQHFNAMYLDFKTRLDTLPN